MNILIHHRVFVKIEINNYSHMFNTEIFFKSFIYFKILFIYFFGYTMQHPRSSSPTVDQAHTPTLDHQGSPPNTEF